MRARNGGAIWGAVRKAVWYLIDSKKCFGIIRAALSPLKSVYDFRHSPKAPATIYGFQPQIQPNGNRALEAPSSHFLACLYFSEPWIRISRATVLFAGSRTTPFPASSRSRSTSWARGNSLATGYVPHNESAFLSSRDLRFDVEVWSAILQHLVILRDMKCVAPLF